MRRNLFVLMASCLALANIAGAAQPPPATEEDKTLYALGVILSRNLQPFAFSAGELAMVQSGLTDGTQGKASIKDADSYVPKLQELQKTRLATAAVKEKAAGAAYLTKAATEAGATKTNSGLVIKTLTAGTGAGPTATDQVKVNYEGKLVNATVFNVANTATQPQDYCKQQQNFLTQVKGMATYTVPKADVILSLAIQSFNGGVRAANYTVTAAITMALAASGSTIARSKSRSVAPRSQSNHKTPSSSVSPTSATHSAGS